MENRPPSDKKDQEQQLEDERVRERIVWERGRNWRIEGKFKTSGTNNKEDSL